MTTPNASDLMILAERMGMPVDEAMRQVTHVLADVAPVAQPELLPVELPQPVATAVA